MKRALVITTISMCFITFGVLADETNPTEKVETTVSAKARHIFDSDVEAQPGEIGAIESRLRVDFDTKIAGKLPFIFAIGATHTDIDSNIPTELPSHLDGWKIRLGAKFPTPFIDSETLFMGFDMYPSQYTDSFENNTSSSFRIPFRVYFIYKESDDFILVGGVLIRPDYDSGLLPVIGFKWQANEKLLFNFVTEDPHIAYKLNEKMTLLGEVDLVSDEYEVTRGNDRNVILKYNEISTGVALRYQFTENIEASFGGGVVFARHIRYEDDQGKVEPDAAGYTNVKITARF